MGNHNHIPLLPQRRTIPVSFFRSKCLLRKADDWSKPTLTQTRVVRVIRGVAEIRESSTFLRNSTKEKTPTYGQNQGSALQGRGKASF